MRRRSVALVVRNDRILLVKMRAFEREFYALPGGGIEDGESAGEAAVRELKEECGVDGRAVKELNTVHCRNGDVEYCFLIELDDGQEISLGGDPEYSEDEQILKEVCWKRLDEISEKDRAFLWAYGLMEADNSFVDEVISWGDDISYPNK